MTTAVFIAWCVLSIRPARYGAKASRRPLRLLPQQLRWRWLDDQSLELSFALPAGAYATVVARELIA